MKPARRGQGSTPALGQAQPMGATVIRIFVALEGSAVVSLGDERLELRSGDTLVVPAGPLFALANPGRQRLRGARRRTGGVRAQLPNGKAFAPS